MSIAHTIPEALVTSRTCDLLTSQWIVHVQRAESYPQHRVRGYYLKTQMRLTKRGGSRAAFAANQTQSKGVPDLLIRLIDWPLHLWLAVELKTHEVGSSGKVLAAHITPEQKYLSDHGAVVICSTPEQVLAAVKSVDQTLFPKRATVQR